MLLIFTLKYILGETCYEAGITELILNILDSHITDSLVCLSGCKALWGVYGNNAKGIKVRLKLLT